VRPAWDGALYAANTAHHRRHDETFLASLPLGPADYVLDLGCGAGDLTVQVAARVPSGHVVGVDPQPSLLAEAATVVLPGESRFDGVLSQSVLHWIPAVDHPGVLAEVHRLVRPGGWFRAEFGGAGNVPTVLALLDDVSAALGGPVTPWFFTDAGWYLEQLERGGFDVADGFVRTRAQRRAFTRDELEGWFLSQCVQAYDAGLPDDAARAVFRAQVDARFDELARWDGTFDQTFVRLDVLARRDG
jgi:SAM-dependent methyltransferase